MDHGHKRKLFINDVAKNSKESENTSEGSPNIIEMRSSLKSEIKEFFYRQIRTSNVFFVIVSILEFVPDLKLEATYLTSVPLILIILINAAFALWKRNKKIKSFRKYSNSGDFEIAEFNWKEKGARRNTTTLGAVEVKFKKSKLLKNLQAGDVIRIRPNDKPVCVPADIVLLGVDCWCHRYDESYSCGRCSISVENLTGDKAILSRQAPEQIADRYKPGLMDYSAILEYAGPTEDVESFDGSLQLVGDQSMASPIRLTNKNFAPRGSLLMNASTVIGIVVFVGEDSKIAFHMGGERKRTRILDSFLDKNVVIIIYLISSLSLILAICFPSSQAITSNPLLGISNDYSWLTRYFQWWMLLQKSVPISLIISIEFINLIKVATDLKTARGTLVNCDMLDELGRVTHMIIDKNISGEKLEVELLGVNAETIHMAGDSRQNSKKGKTLDQDSKIHIDDSMGVLLAICNQIDTENSESSRIVLDQAQLAVANKLGFTLEKKSSKDIVMVAQGKTRRFDIVEVIPFPSETDLMGLFIVEHKDGADISKLVIRGSPENVKSLLKQIQERDRETEGIENRIKVQDFRAGGYKAVWFAEGVLTEEEFAKLKDYLSSTQYRKKENLEKKANALSKVYAPKDMEVIGSIGLKQKVSIGVQKTISKLKKAGIKMILVTDESHENSKLYAEELGMLSKRKKTQNISMPIKDIDFDRSDDTLKRLDEILKRKDGKTILVVSGRSFEHIISKHQESKLKQACDSAQSIIFTSLEVYQRSKVVQIFTKNKEEGILSFLIQCISVRVPRKSCVLVVGDSSNDIPMIKEADISIYKQRENIYSMDAGVFTSLLADFTILGKKEKLHIFRFQF